MSPSRFLSVKRGFAAGCAMLTCLGTAVAAGAPEARNAQSASTTQNASTAQNASAPPACVAQTLPGARLAGAGTLRFFGLPIYDARLWVGPRFDAQDYGAHPLALELTYHRSFSGAAIAQRSIREISRERSLSPALSERWREALEALMPDVQAGDRLIGDYRPGQGMRLSNGCQALGTIDDPALAQAFFGIWLSRQTSEPELRKALLVRVTRSTP